ncbi:MAG: hypothetical protein ACI8RZ_003006 [Myxococcota bacterium]|jgi:hypothetical protein
MSALLVILSACTNTPSPPQSTPAVPDGPVHVQLGQGSPVENPISSEQLVAVYPDLALLEELPRLAVVGVMNLVPALCEPCEDSLAVCAMAPPTGCENVPVLVARAVRVAAEGGDPNVIRAAVSYADVWVADATRAESGAVDVEVWIDASSPSTSETLARLAAVSEAVGDVPIQWHLRVFWDDEVEEELPGALALLAAEEQSAGLAFLKAGGEAPGVIPDAAIFHARQGEAALTERLKAEQAVARSKGVRSTPTWFVEGYRLRGLQGEQTITNTIQQSWKDLKMASSAQELDQP